ncbi:MAG: hypothetical protein JOZ41_07615, partial [Chloroflexi bacterium]|nr:hypothetical protein [Chloroflexota bacterium]
MLHAPARASAGDLALPSSLLAAGNGTQGTVGSGQGPFRSYHHTWNGFQSGVAAQFTFQSVLTIFYQGSIFSDAGSASAFMADSFALTESWASGSPTDCSGTAGVPCEITAFATTNGEEAAYSVGQVNYCVIEAGVQGDPTFINQNTTDVANAVAAVFMTGIAEAKAACAAVNQTGTQLRVPASAFSPAAINSNYDYAERATDADQDWFMGNHSAKYETLGFVTGYYERADYQNSTNCQNSTGATFICFRYQGSAYGSTAQAAAAYQDGVSATQRFSAVSPQDCTSNGVPCTLLGYADQDGSVEVYAILQVSQCLAEIAATAPPTVVSNNQSLIAQTVA